MMGGVSAHRSSSSSNSMNLKIIDYKRFKNSAADHRPSPSRSSMPRVDITRFLVKKNATGACHVVFVRRRHAEYIDSFVCSATTSGGSGGFCSSTRLRIAQHAGMSVSMYSTGSYEPVHSTHTHTHARTHTHAQMASVTQGTPRRAKRVLVAHTGGRGSKLNHKKTLAGNLS